MRISLKYHLLAALLGIVFTTKLHSQLPNAWQINDNLTTAGVIEYLTNLTTAQVSSASTNGWRYDLVTRMISDSGSAAAHSMAFGDGTRRFYIFFDLDGSGQLTAQLLGGTTHTLTSAANATNYHSHQMTYDPITSNATYRVDGAVIASWPGQVSVGQSNQVMWGANASAGRGVMNYHRARFEIVGQGVIASYDAGLAGNPAVAPSPTNQAWTRFTSGGALVESPVSPDTVALPPLVTTLDIGTGLQSSSVAWGDYDNDGWIDVLLAGHSGGNPVSQIWRNTGSGFTNINAGLPGIGNFFLKSHVAWGDYDNDGRLDIVLTGISGGNGLTQIWRNTGSGFTNINAGLPGFFDGSADWGDFDNDGRLDLILCGQTNDSIWLTQIWRNTGNGFVHINAGLPGIIAGSVAWGDYDNDGWLDVALSGHIGLNPITQIWRNTGSSFTNINAGLLPAAFRSTVAWGDYDNDGRLDLLQTGDTTLGDSTAIWRNTGSGFTNINAGLTGVEFGSGVWGDYDNDGLLDVLLAGSGISQIWRNTGNGFTNLNAGLPGITEGSAAWGDANNDGRLDVLLSGSGFTQVRFNLQPAANTPPTAPSGLVVTTNFPSVSLAWNAASDGQTPVAGLTYNLRIGTVPGGADIVGPQADASGLRRVPAIGNAQTHTNAVFLLTAGTYYWSVQAVDGAFAGSPFATEDSFSIPALPIAFTLPATDLQEQSAVLNASVNPNTLATSYYFEYGLTTNYGNFTVTNSLSAGISPVVVSETISGLNTVTTYHFRIVASNATATVMGMDQFFATTQINTNGLPQVERGSVAWGDYDRDGRLDLVLAGEPFVDIWRNIGNGFSNLNVGMNSPPFGDAVSWMDYDNDGDLDVLRAALNQTQSGLPAFIELWRNTGNSFTQVNTSITPLGFGSLAWGDFDNDGQSDLLITGIPTFTGVPTSQISRNTGNGFANLNAGLPGVWRGSVAWADFDNDNRLDFILTGALNSTGTSVASQIWRNTGSGFTNISAGLPGVAFSSVAWGDYDNDGWLDLLLAGTTNPNSTNSGVAQIWRNTGTGFTNINAGLPVAYMGSVAWGDYDNDGLLDILLAGTTNSFPKGALSQVWRNTGNGFTNLDLGLPGVYSPFTQGGAAFGDHDNDGRLDIFLSGTTTNSQPFSGVWSNHEPTTNTPPAAPSALYASMLNGQVQFSWNPATDAETPSAGLSYNLRVGTAPGAGDVVSPEAETNGFRLLPVLGNAQLGTNTFLNLQPGNYYWSVQAVDAAFAGGSFATEASFFVPPPTLSIVNVGTNAIISWQPSYPGWILQESLSLAPAAWSNASSGPTNPAAVPVALPTKFYRLFKP